MIAGRRCWIFDLDGTLTVAALDFLAIRRELGLARGRPILEALADLPEARAEPLYRRLAEIERGCAERARAADGARPLLEALAERGARIGILTNNTHANALETLRACALGDLFRPCCVLGRENAAPKPDSAGVLRLLSHWDGRPEDAIVVGDHRFDLIAGRAAGALAVHIDPKGEFPFAEYADLCVSGLPALHQRLLSD